MTAADERKRTATSIGWRIYQQISAIIGAIAIIAFITNFVDFDWSDWIASLIGAWDEFVRPPVHWALHHLLEVPSGWAGWDFEVPQWLRDYFAVGFVLGLSLVRNLAGLLDDSKWYGFLLAFVMLLLPEYTIRHKNFDYAARWLPFMVCLWPISLTWFVFDGMRGQIVPSRRYLHRHNNFTPWNRSLVIVSPFIYAGVLLALNYVLPI